jgi:hypothetical protein
MPDLQPPPGHPYFGCKKSENADTTANSTIFVHSTALMRHFFERFGFFLSKNCLRQRADGKRWEEDAGLK